MKTKFFFLIISWMLVASCGLYAQSSEFVLDDEEVNIIVTEQPTDTITVAHPEVIRITTRTWDNMEEPLKEKVIQLSKGQSQMKISRDKVRWVYEVTNIPTLSGKRTAYLSILDNHDYFLSKEDPNDAEVICGCFLQLQQPENILITPSKHQTDDSVFGEAEPNGHNVQRALIEF